jgi:hypothetical protein
LGADEGVYRDAPFFLPFFSFVLSVAGPYSWPLEPRGGSFSSEKAGREPDEIFAAVCETLLRRGADFRERFAGGHDFPFLRRHRVCLKARTPSRAWSAPGRAPLPRGRGPYHRPGRGGRKREGAARRSEVFCTAGDARTATWFSSPSLLS